MTDASKRALSQQRSRQKNFDNNLAKDTIQLYVYHISEVMKRCNNAYPTIYCQGTRRVDVYTKTGSKASNADY